MRRGHRTLWTVEDDDRLRELIAASASVTLMAVKLRRSTEAIRMRIIKLRREAGMQKALTKATDVKPI